LTDVWTIYPANKNEPEFFFSITCHRGNIHRIEKKGFSHGIMTALDEKELCQMIVEDPSSQIPYAVLLLSNSDPATNRQDIAKDITNLLKLKWGTLENFASGDYVLPDEFGFPRLSPMVDDRFDQIGVCPLTLIQIENMDDPLDVKSFQNEIFSNSMDPKNEGYSMGTANFIKEAIIRADTLLSSWHFTPKTKSFNIGFVSYFKYDELGSDKKGIEVKTTYHQDLPVNSYVLMVGKKNTKAREPYFALLCSYNSENMKTTPQKFTQKSVSDAFEKTLKKGFPKNVDTAYQRLTRNLDMIGQTEALELDDVYPDMFMKPWASSEKVI